MYNRAHIQQRGKHVFVQVFKCTWKNNLAEHPLVVVCILQPKAVFTFDVFFYYKLFHPKAEYYHVLLYKLEHVGL